jgi:hypothetical protein
VRVAGLSILAVAALADISTGDSELVALAIVFLAAGALALASIPMDPLHLILSG